MPPETLSIPDRDLSAVIVTLGGRWASKSLITKGDIVDISNLLQAIGDIKDPKAGCVVNADRESCGVLLYGLFKGWEVVMIVQGIANLMQAS